MIIEKIKTVVEKLKTNQIEVSLFIDPNEKSVKLSKDLNVEFVELHTGTYANIYAMLYSNLQNTQHSIKELELSKNELLVKLENSFEALKNSSILANSLGLKVAAGHGLNYQNVKKILEIKDIIELNIGQSIVARSVFTGLERAIKDMKNLLKR